MVLVAPKWALQEGVVCFTYAPKWGGNWSGGLALAPKSGNMLRTAHSFSAQAGRHAQNGS